MRCVLINSIVVKVVVKERLLLLLLLLFDLLYAPLATTSKGKVTPKNTFSSSFL
tara:strand:- start:231 stop:392 length:162 start_codon:yes stop_codon:yes gene_type:complete